jgi:hypothetical protein
MRKAKLTEHTDSVVGLDDDGSLVLVPVNVFEIFKFDYTPKLAKAFQDRRWFFWKRKGPNGHHLMGFLREPKEKHPPVVRIEQIYLGPLPWTKKIVFKNGDTKDYRKANVELVPRKTPKTSW